MGTLLSAFLGPETASTSLAFYLLWGLVIYILILLVFALGLVGLTIYLHRSNERKAQKWTELEKAWEPLIGKIITKSISVAQVHQQINVEQGLFFVDFLTRYSMRLSGASRQTLEALAAPWLPKLAERVSDGDEEQRARAVFTLSALAPEHYRIVIASALEDPVPLVSMLAAHSLAENHAIEYLNVLLKHMDRFRAWSPGYLTSMLVELGKPYPEKLRQALLEHDYPIWIQTVVLRALSELNDLASVPLAAELLASDTDPELQAAALDVLAKLGYEQHKERVRQKCRDPRFVIRLHAVKALTRLGDAQDLPLFESLLNDPSQWVAFQAAQGLKAIEALDLLEQIADSEHPRAELAQQVLYNLDSDALLLSSAQSARFVKRVPQWMRNVIRKPSSAAWQRVQGVLFNAQTHPEVRMAIAEALTPDASAVMQPLIKRQLSLSQEADPSYLYRALYQLNPLGSLETLRQQFFDISSEPARLEIMGLLLRHRTPTTQNFVLELRQRLENGLERSAELSGILQQKLDAFSPLPS